MHSPLETVDFSRRCGLVAGRDLPLRTLTDGSGKLRHVDAAGWDRGVDDIKDHVSNDMSSS